MFCQRGFLAPADFVLRKLGLLVAYKARSGTINIETVAYTQWTIKKRDTLIFDYNFG